jgi:hypothetical protein
LIEALDNIASVKALDRTNRGTNAQLVDRISLGGGVDQDDNKGQIFGAIVTEKSLTRDFTKEILAWLTAHPRREWPNLYVDAHRFMTPYRYMWSDPGRAPRRVVGHYTMLAEALAISKPNPDADPPLVFFGRYLLDWFPIVPRIDFNPQSYLPVKWPEYQDLAFPAGESTEAKEQGSHMESPDSKN